MASTRMMAGRLYSTPALVVTVTAGGPAHGLFATAQYPVVTWDDQIAGVPFVAAIGDDDGTVLVDDDGTVIVSD